MFIINQQVQKVVSHNLESTLKTGMWSFSVEVGSEAEALRRVYPHPQRSRDRLWDKTEGWCILSQMGTEPEPTHIERVEAADDPTAERDLKQGCSTCRDKAAS